MFVRHLSVADFRSWESAEVPLQPGPTVLVGRNGIGKTNLVEALGYLATLSSHRVAADAPLIRRGADRAMVQAAVVSAGRELVLDIEISAGKANKARINRSPTRPAGLLGVLRTVVFAPEDLSLVRGDPSDRRRSLDELLTMRTPRMAGVRRDYDRVLRQRSALLKTAGSARRSGDLSTLDVWDSHAAQHGSELMAGRLELVHELRPQVIEAYREIAPESAPVGMTYRSSLGDQLDEILAADPTPSAARLATALLAKMAERRAAELDRGVCLVGPHRDDLDLILGDGPAKGYASHGESWSIALALRLGAFGLLRADGVDPVLILDDVFAELDTARRDQLAGMVAGAEQVIITAAVEHDVPAALSGRRLRVTGSGTARIDGPEEVTDGDESPAASGPEPVRAPAEILDPALPDVGTDVAG